MEDFLRKKPKNGKFRREPTEELIKYCIDVFNSYNLKYEIREHPCMFWIWNKEGKKYAYYYTTDMWTTADPNIIIHYKDLVHFKSKNLEDFLKRFLFKNLDTDSDYKEKYRLKQGKKLDDLIKSLDDVLPNL
jgi:hypothetical protein